MGTIVNPREAAPVVSESLTDTGLRRIRFDGRHYIACAAFSFDDEETVIGRFAHRSDAAAALEQHRRENDTGAAR
jgi:hypothetical protein